MKKAETIEDIYDVFAPEKYLTKEDKEFYVDLYGDKFKSFVTALKFNKVPSKTFFIAGQSGNGKSTVLNLLTTNFEEIEEKYTFHTVAGKNIFLYNDIDIVDILLMIGSTLIQNNETLEKAYFDKLRKLGDIKDGTLEESEINSSSKAKGASIQAKMGIGVKFLSIIKSGIDIIGSYKVNEEIRTDARKFFKIKRKELIDLTNEIISEYKREQSNDKDLIVIIDDLEKKNNVDELFLKEMSLLNELNIIKIITMPIHLYRNETFPSEDVREFGLKLKNFDDSVCTEDKDLLHEVIMKRVNDNTLITEDAVKLAIDNSGANLRQLIRLVHIGAEKVLTHEGNQITINEIQYAVDSLQLAYSSKVNNMKTFLTQIKNTKAYEDNAENLMNIARATKMELVFAYFNGIEWYELNPVIRDALQKYNAMGSNENTSN